MGVDPTLTDTGESSESRALVGTMLGPYKIERLLGEGAMGEVFLATHVSLGRPVAIKTLKPAVAADRGLTERFFAEARAVNIIRHENIVECTDLVNDPQGRSYIVMELLEGKTLGAAIRDVGRIPPRRAARIVAQIADAIHAAHGKGIVHRDLKPDNVFLIRRAGSADYVKVLDFGIARLRPELGGVAATQSGALIGTPAYMSPEQVRGEKADPASDVYAVGTILFHMLAGRLPFDAASLSMMLVAQLQETPARVDRLVPDVPRALADVIERALAKQPAKRPPSMAALRTEVLEAVGLPVDATASLIDSSPALRIAPGDALAATLPPDAPSIAPGAIGRSSISAAAAEVMERPRRSRVIWLGAALGAGAVATLLVVAPWRRSTPQAQPPPPAIAQALDATVAAVAPDAPAPPIDAPPQVLTSEMIQQVTLRAAPEVKNCLETHRTLVRKAEGTLGARVTVQRDGRTTVRLDAWARGTPIAACVDDVVAQLGFPAHANDEVVADVRFAYKLPRVTKAPPPSIPPDAAPKPDAAPATPPVEPKKRDLSRDIITPVPSP